MQRSLAIRLGATFVLAGCVLSACHHAVQPEAARIRPRVDTVSGARFVIDPAGSTVRVFVYRGGALAALGHNHVLVAHGIIGEFGLADDGHAAYGRFMFAVARFSVDDSEERTAAGADFPGAIDPADIQGTRRNLLGPDVLDASAYPQVVVEFAGASGGPDDYVVSATVIVRGVASAVAVPVHVARAADGLAADGEVTLSQLRLGITPFSVMLGALKVEDGVRVRFHLVARRAS